MTRGPANFTQPEFTENPWLNGTRLSGQFRFSFEPTVPVHLLQMGRGIVVQAPLLEDTDPQDANAWAISWFMRAAEEVDYRTVRHAQAMNEPVWLIPYSVEVEGFKAQVGDNTYNLTRPLASAKEASFESGTYQTRAWIDGVEQTVITSGVPSAGEVLVENDDEVTPATVSGSAVDLVVEYYPAYPVIIPRTRKNLAAFNDLTMPITALEVTKQEPS